MSDPAGRTEPQASWGADGSPAPGAPKCRRHQAEAACLAEPTGEVPEAPPLIPAPQVLLSPKSASWCRSPGQSCRRCWAGPRSRRDQMSRSSGGSLRLGGGCTRAPTCSSLLGRYVPSVCRFSRSFRTSRATPTATSSTASREKTTMMAVMAPWDKVPEESGGTVVWLLVSFVISGLCVVMVCPQTPPQRAGSSGRPSASSNLQPGRAMGRPDDGGTPGAPSASRAGGVGHLRPPGVPEGGEKEKVPAWGRAQAWPGWGDRSQDTPLSPPGPPPAPEVRD